MRLQSNKSFNASLIVSLAMIGKFELLWELFEEVYIPKAVYQEVVIKGSEKSGAQELQHSILYKWSL